jgi:hypothetical protein
MRHRSPLLLVSAVKVLKCMLVLWNTLLVSFYTKVSEIVTLGEIETVLNAALFLRQTERVLCFVLTYEFQHTLSRFIHGT